MVSKRLTILGREIQTADSPNEAWGEASDAKRVAPGA